MRNIIILCFCIMMSITCAAQNWSSVAGKKTKPTAAPAKPKAQNNDAAPKKNTAAPKKSTAQNTSNAQTYNSRQNTAVEREEPIRQQEVVENDPTKTTVDAEELARLRRVEEEMEREKKRKAAKIDLSHVKQPILGIMPITLPTYYSENDKNILQSKIEEAVRNTGRVYVVESKLLDRADVKYYLTVNVSSLEAKSDIYVDETYEKQGDSYKKIIKGRYPYCEANMKYSIKITDSATGRTEKCEFYEKSEGGINIVNKSCEYNSDYDAYMALLKSCIKQDEITVLIFNTFKPKGKILQVEEGDAKKAKTVYIDLGKDNGIAQKQVLEVYKETNIAGEIASTQIGELEIVEVLGTNRTLAKVKKGGDEIQKALSSGKTITVIPRDVKVKFWGGVK